MSDRPDGARFQWEFNLASVLQTAIVLGCSIFSFVTTSATKSEQTARDLTSFRAEVATKLQETQIDHRARFDDLGRAISALPDQTAALRQLENRVTRLESKGQELDRQLAELSAKVYQAAADLGAISASNRQKLGQRQ